MKHKIEIEITEDNKERITSVAIKGARVNVEHLLAAGKAVLEGAVDMLIENSKDTDFYEDLKGAIKSTIAEDMKDIYKHMKEYIENK